ncbi:hypothetical protein B9Z55_010998 [Caenorhabditis nigoni]|nr:hypothetical protein B9Z55_010998 [Caenorhabditis nigoni]
MTNAVLLLLSFGSFNVKEMIKLTQRKRLNNLGSMVFCTGSPNEEVYISNIIYNQGKPVREIQEPILGIAGGYMKVEKDWFQVKMCGELIYFQISDIYRPILCYSNCNKEILIKCLHRCLHDFFGGEIEYQWWTHANKIVFPEVEDLTICIKANSPKAFWGALPQNISIKHFEGYDLMMDPLKRSDFYKIECLRLHVFGSVVEDVLRNIEGRQADITCSVGFNYSKLGNFLKRWKLGKARHKLEYFKVQIQDNMDRNGIPKVDILNYARCKKLDDSRYGPSHSIPFACGSHYPTPTTPSFWSHDYVVRESDKRVANVRIEDFCFIFGVWEMAETEFLKMAAKEGPYLRLEYL